MRSGLSAVLFLVVWLGLLCQVAQHPVEPLSWSPGSYCFCWAGGVPLILVVLFFLLGVFIPDRVLRCFGRIWLVAARRRMFARFLFGQGVWLASIVVAVSEVVWLASPYLMSLSAGMLSRLFQLFVLPVLVLWALRFPVFFLVAVP